jgi:DNA/RNA endonuclease G (NUC1)
VANLLEVKPVVSYPRSVRPGESALVSIDLRPADPAAGWPYAEEEYVVDFLFDSGPLVSVEPVGEPSVVLHRFGGTYGPAHFLLTAGGQPGEARVQVRLVNGWGIPVGDLSLPEIAVSATGVPDLEPAGTEDATLEVPRPSVKRRATAFPEYDDREGYDPEFFGTGALYVPMPMLRPKQFDDAAHLLAFKPGANRYELKYHHFSVVMNRKRRLAFFTAVNIDDRRLAEADPRAAIWWSADPRVEREAQVDEEFLGDVEIPFDRGQLVRRFDPAWGGSTRIAEAAYDDTFHYTNCYPQSAVGSSKAKVLWAGLEDFLLDRAAGERKRMTVFTGPVLADDDPEYRDFQFPRWYWKVAVVEKPDGGLGVLGFLVCHIEKVVISGMDELVGSEQGAYQVNVAEIERLTGLGFDVVRDAEASDHIGEEGEPRRIIETYDDIRIPWASRDRQDVAAEAPATDTGPVPEWPAFPTSILIAFDDEGRERSDTPDGLASARVFEALRTGTFTDVVLFAPVWVNDVHDSLEFSDVWLRTMSLCHEDRQRAEQSRPVFRPLFVVLSWPCRPWGEERLRGLQEADLEALIEGYASRLGNPPGIRDPLRVVLADAAERDRAPNSLPSEVRAAYQTIVDMAGVTYAGPAASPGSEGDGFDPEAIYAEMVDSPVSFGSTRPDPLGAVQLLAPLRALSFKKTMDRALKLGEGSVHGLVARLRVNRPDVRFHLVGHGFGGIVASAAVAGPPSGPGLSRPVQSLSLVQGILSSWSFSRLVPFETGLPGYFHRLIAERLIAGPILTTMSELDGIARRWYPRAAGAARRVEYAPGSLPNYGAVGAHGLRGEGIDPIDLPLGGADRRYDFRGGGVYNLDAGPIIRTASDSIGTHLDVLQHVELAHAVWSAMLAGPENA